MRNNYLFSASLLVGALFNSALVDAQVYLVGEQITMSDVNNNGVAVGNGYNTTHFRWTKADGAKNIGSVSVGLLSGSTRVSDDGNIIAGTMTNSSTNLNEMSYYNNTTGLWTNLGGIVGSSDDSKSSAWGISRDGKTIVGLGFINAAIGEAIKWTEADGIVQIGSTVTGSSSRANAINADQSVIVGWQDDETGFRQGAYWKNGVQSIIKNNDNEPVGEAGGVSDDGNTIIGYYGLYPYVWNAVEGYTQISHPNSGVFFRGGATSITADGKTVIGYFRPWPGGPYFGEGFIWTKEKGRLNLNDYVTSLGIDTQGMKFSLPLAISPDGHYIAGAGVTADNKIYGFVIDLTAYLSVGDTSKESVAIYPNPVKNVLNFSGTQSVTSIEIYNLAGQVVKKQEKISSNQINLSDLAKGNYFVKAKINGEEQTFKFIKE